MGIFEFCFPAHENRAGVVWDHRLQKLLIPHESLSSHEVKENDEEEYGSHGENEIEFLVWIHRSHKKQHSNGHGGDHHHSHVELIHVNDNVLWPIYHRVHHGKHDYKMGQEHRDKTHIRIFIVLMI